MSQNKESVSIPQTIQRANSAIRMNFDSKTGRTLRLAGVSGTTNLFLGLGKLLLGIYALSFFACVSAFYTFGMAIAKYFALTGILKAKTVKEQYRYYFLSGIILIIASAVFVVYSIRLFYHPTTSVFHMYVAIAIAAVTFTELTLNIRGIIIERHNRTPLFHAIKMLNLASSLICLVLTQTAILSFADAETSIHPAVNGLVGIIMGSSATLIGVIMIIRIKRMQKNENNGIQKYKTDNIKRSKPCK